jgi:hypothetical protein
MELLSSAKLSTRKHLNLRKLSDFSDSTLEGIWVFHRHGDRSPNRFLLAEHRYDEEAEFWLTKVPPTDLTHYEWLRQMIPTRIHESNNEGKFLDAGRAPFGFLTWKGMNQMRDKGYQFASRYHRNFDDPITDHFKIKAYSTNYLRTVKSCQCFLDGLFSRSGNHVKENFTQYEHIDPEYFQTSLNHDVVIEVRDRKQDTLNAFDKSPELMKKLVGDVVNTDEFLERDTKATTLAARLTNFLPGLLNSRSYGGSSGINWIHASDHFVCRSSHDIPFSKYSNLEYDPNTELALKGMHHSTLAHLSWRFRMWYQSPPLLAAIAGPPLQEILNHIEEALGSSNLLKRKPLTIYSCHDVTILSILYGLNATFLAPEKDLKDVNVLDSRGENRWRYWPDYSSTLAIELHRVKRDTGLFDHEIRVMLNEVPVSTIGAIKARKTDMSLETFQNLVSNLNDTICHDVQSKIDTDVERDMSGWTG